ncbi:MAG: tetratricopeptide repeat protein [Acidobacteria bacterium]|nr:tetratricopeptide repeat protein [Acidobacteriota bacterium]
MTAARPRKGANRTAAKPRSPGHSPPLSTPSPPSDSPLPAGKPVFSGLLLWVSLALIAANLAVYASVRHFGFVSFDDPVYVSDNAHIQDGLTWHGMSWAFTASEGGNWNPLVWFSHMLDIQIYGLNPGPHHVTNLLLHIANTLLLFGLLYRMTGAMGRSAFVAGLFGLHPLHVESVAWVSERKDVLSTLFWMLTLWGYIGYVRRPKLGRYLVVLLLFTVGLMAKPMLVTLPFALLLLDYWPLGRVTLVARPATRPGWAIFPDQRSTLRRLLWEKVPLLALAAAASFLTFMVQQSRGAVAGIETNPLTLRAENALVSYVAYIGKMLWPARLAVFYPYPQSLPAWWVTGAILGLTSVSLVVIRAARRYVYLPVGWLWYLGTLVPVIGLVQVGSQSMADRYTYVPLIGLFVIAAWGVPDFLARWQYKTIALPAAAALVILGCTITAWSQVRYWENSMALWGHALEVTTGNYRAHTAVGAALEDQGRISEAIYHYSEALHIKPGFVEGHNNLGNVLASQGKVSEAIEHYTEALRIDPGFAEAHNGVGSALASQGRISEAITHYSEALRIKPDYAEAHNNLGLALADQGRINEAIDHYYDALRINPGFASAHNSLGNALADQGRNSEAIAHYYEALRLQPAFAEAHNNLGSVLDYQGRISEAIAHYYEALRLQPAFAEAHNNLGSALVKQGKTDEAIHEFLEALRTKPNEANLHYKVAVLLGEQSKIEEAALHLEAALKINPGHQRARRMLDELTRRGRSGGK